jgi:hypothetical protein
VAAAAAGLNFFAADARKWTRIGILVLPAQPELMDRLYSNTA